MSLEGIATDYPTIATLFGSDWLRDQLGQPREKKTILTLYLEAAEKDKPIIKKIEEELRTAKGVDRTNALMQLEFFSGSVGPMSILESCLSELRGNSGLPTLLKELRSPDEKFYSALTVANLGCYFYERGKVDLYPKIQLSSKVKTPDLRVDLSGRSIWVEATTPGLAKIMLEHEGEMVGLKERALGQIKDEFVENFSDAIAEGKLISDPILIALDCSRSEIDQVSIESALFGKQYLQFLVNKETHELAGERVLRRDPGFRDVQGMEMVSAILYTKRAERRDDRTLIGGVLTLSPYAKNPLNETETSKIDLFEVY